MISINKRNVWLVTILDVVLFAAFVVAAVVLSMKVNPWFALLGIGAVVTMVDVAIGHARFGYILNSSASSVGDDDEDCGEENEDLA